VRPIQEKNINIPERTVDNHAHSTDTLLMRLFPEQRGEAALYRFRRNSV
jgi:hypothetical protein